jgi:hypothetical protein
MSGVQWAQKVLRPRYGSRYREVSQLHGRDLCFVFLNSSRPKIVDSICGGEGVNCFIPWILNPTGDCLQRKNIID